ncbi:urea ABC transporter permease subunit UrtB [Anaeromyxobacter paludicola]|uniref:Branched-chain amino acid ABC transporter permease n=1 Tax=Anaeromyxobacter paludicola TaxID=2918171 RepID=A0ABN6N840_9BACT|nr:urea ABC transporter permease subunit UrtB [Anaeromyxobacter paludicola]BDG09201.1 branched-chain amino acid ABC transporter permease [Anaeromyxobacter paludicola]
MRPLTAALFLLLLAPAAARAALDPQAVAKLGAEDSEEKLAGVDELARSADPAAARVLQALAEDNLQVANGRVLLLDGERTLDATTLAEVDPAPEGAEPITINNRIRRHVGTALAALRLSDPDRRARLAAAQELADGASLELAPALKAALDREQDREVKPLLALAYAQATLQSPEPAARLSAVKALRDSGNPRVERLLGGLLADGAETDPDVRREALASLEAVRHRLAMGELVGRVFSGLSLGSILLLAALGLAITYGLMGVINMAHGELLMIGAYATYAMQGVFARHFPRHHDWYVVAAVPVAFLAAGLVGAVLERTVIRFLYGRPLETLLATWGASLVLSQAARSTFGAQNVSVANPSWMSGGVPLVANAVLPWNRIVIVAFSLAVLGLVWLAMNRTRFGLFLRAVTQNRAMAGCVGVPTGRLDTLAFAAGAGIAGLGGVALSQIANVGPDMGQAYIVDSFMVVVLGGVGQLAGAVWAALGLGVLSKFLEGWSGAVIAKIAVLAFIIVFIQKRPQGLFALKGRFAED